tara:strand:+ start:22141 stop:22401 length:261 start_codon:yes stop_codon:yes gene_type:complete
MEELAEGDFFIELDTDFVDSSSSVFAACDCAAAWYDFAGVVDEVDGEECSGVHVAGVEERCAALGEVAGRDDECSGVVTIGFNMDA